MLEESLSLEEQCLPSNITQFYQCECGMSREEATKIYEPAKLVIEGCLTIGINIFGFVANLISINVLFRTKLTNLFNKTLFILAIFDLIFNVCDILEIIRITYYDKLSCHFMPFHQELHLYLTPQIIRPLRMFVIIASMYTTVVIALERYLAVSKPIITFVERDEDTWKKLFTRMFPVMIISLILTLPLSFEFYVQSTCFLCLNDRQVAQFEEKGSCKSNNIELRCENNLMACGNTDIPRSFFTFFEKSSLQRYCYLRMIPILEMRDFRVDKMYIIVYKYILSGIMTYVVPLISLFFLNWLIYKHLRGRRKAIKGLGKK